MDKKDRIDGFGVVALTGFAVLLAFNQVVIKVANGGLQPVFFAGIRSLGAVLCLLAWLRFRGIPLDFGRGAVRWAGLAIGLVFSFEFMFLFIALDLTTVGRSAVLFYSMPVWMVIGAHLFVPGERLSGGKIAGLVLALLGVVWAMLGRVPGVGSLWGDLAAVVASILWAATGLLAKSSALRQLRPEMQLIWQVGVSAPVLLVMSLFYGDFIRDLAPIHLWGLAFQIVVVVSAGYLFWLWLLSIYPASGVASFSFLSPIFSVFLGWLLLDEAIAPSLVVSLLLVVAGIILINRHVPRANPSSP
ncbi:DMT family transporter [Flavimaricola marinus]|uniref:Putative inner membrane transporter yiJE n=1 Tax=Flavimaricola marinus TaxID=1819565 RepID=A0A238LJ64_9RHOB|nr:DMT family transporter [Flavimaricola marinus]SMY09691.1 putative inner membrane transporter yiJE [Flavimaricola marinus]